MPDAYADSLKILQVSPSDGMGGAEGIALALHRAYRAAGCPAWLAVGRSTASIDGALPIPNDENRSGWARAWLNVAHRTVPTTSGRGALLRRMMKFIAEPIRRGRTLLGHEDFNFPAAWNLLQLPPVKPDVLHLHNLHGTYFDLRALPALADAVPVFLTLHDAWMLSGHCAHSFECERWKTGCGACPDLGIYPPLRRDATAYNWRRKRSIYAGRSLHVAAPCSWLMKKVDESILAPAVVSRRVIPNGIDLSTFGPGSMQEARQRLGLPQDARTLLYVGKGLKKSPWRDYTLLLNAVTKLASGNRSLGKILVLAVGEAAPDEETSGAGLRFLPPETDPTRLAMYYRAADVYIHPAKVDTFPTAILEALACGTPVVATDVGGIPEQVHPLGPHETNVATGILVPPADAAALAEGLRWLLTEPSLLHTLSENASKDARLRFDRLRQARAYVEWFREESRRIRGVEGLRFAV